MGECQLNPKCWYLFLFLRPALDTRMNGHQGMGCMASIGNFQLSNQAGSHRQRGVPHREERRLLNALISGPLIGQRVRPTSSLAAAILTTQTIRFDPIVN